MIPLLVHRCFLPSYWNNEFEPYFDDDGFAGRLETDVGANRERSGLELHQRGPIVFLKALMAVNCYYYSKFVLIRHCQSVCFPLGSRCYEG